MNNLIYNTVILSYSGAIHFAKLFSPKARLWVNGRKNWRKQLIEKRKLDDNWLWFHCASLGEYEDSCEIVLEIRKKQPQLKALLTFFSPSGYEQLKNSKNFLFLRRLEFILIGTKALIFMVHRKVFTKHTKSHSNTFDFN